MKAAVFHQAGKPLTVEDIDKPVIGAKEMLVKVSKCGICGTDIHASRAGPFLAPPKTVFGHEFVGAIVEIGQDIQNAGFNIGDRITSLPVIEDKTIGLGEITGAYSEYVKVGYDSVIKIPDELSDLDGALIEPLAVGLHSVKMADTVAEKNILIIGAGPIGLAVALWCRFFGARKIVISEMSPARINMAKTLGFSEFVDAGGDVGAQFQKLAGDGPEIQFECVGGPGILQQCIDRAPKRGTLMGIGVCDDSDTIVPLAALVKELKIQWVIAYDKEDFEFAIEMMVAGRLQASAMVTHVVSLLDLPEAFEQLRKPATQCKVIIDLTL